MAKNTTASSLLRIKLPEPLVEKDAEDIMKEYEDMLRRKARIALLKQLALEAEREAREIERELTNPNQGVNPFPTPNTQNPAPNILSQIPPEALKELMKDPEAYNKLLALVAASTNPWVGMWMAMLTALKPQQPQQDFRDKILETLLKAVVERQQTDGNQQLIQLVLNLLKERDDAKWQQVLEKMSKLVEKVNRPGILDTILLNDKVRQVVEKVLGARDPRIEIELKKLELELERLRAERELKLKKLELEMKERKRQAKMWAYALRKLGETIAETLSGVSPESAQQATQPVLARAKCPKCGEMVIGHLGEVVKCPKCGTALKLVAKR